LPARKFDPPHKAASYAKIFTNCSSIAHSSALNFKTVKGFFIKKHQLTATSSLSLLIFVRRYFFKALKNLSHIAKKAILYEYFHILIKIFQKRLDIDPKNV
jgi:hypothetical protein